MSEVLNACPEKTVDLIHQLRDRLDCSPIRLVENEVSFRTRWSGIQEIILYGQPDTCHPPNASNTTATRQIELRKVQLGDYSQGLRMGRCGPCWRL